ncbi:hypothetical protein KSP40_PGU021775 [Platanthera guangdongensis]|uniref:Secreted protein n=1 Tax=Platanthera guangdongensis TaxID=2320717 RepID=A0ABR2LT42_9ASPA
MVNWDAVISVVLGVVMRKCICRFHEAGLVAVEFFAVFESVLRSSGLVFRQPELTRGAGKSPTHRRSHIFTRAQGWWSSFLTHPEPGKDRHPR